MKNRTRKVLMICILACAMFLTTAISPFGSCASAEYIPASQNAVDMPTYTPDVYKFSTDYVINGVQYGYGEFEIPSNVILSRRFGSYGYCVKGCQAALQKIHAFHTEYNCWPGEVDCSYGPATETAVRNFQNVVGIVVDGDVGPQTWQHLEEACFNQ